MFYRLKDNYVLRGWENLPYAVVDTRKGEPLFLTPDRMKALELCDGNIDVSMPFIADETRALISEFEHDGIVEQCREGEDLKEKQKYKKYPCRYINNVHWAITGNCNYRCKHCFLSVPNVKISELPHDKIMEIVRQLGECGVMNLSLTGGEPFIRKDFFDIADALKEQNIVIEYINTNGSYITEKVLEEFIKRDIRPEFRISFDGVGWHDWLRGIPGSEEKANKVIRMCHEMGFPLNTITVIHKGNAHTIRDTVNHLASLGVDKVGILHAADVGEWLERNGVYKLSLEERWQLYLDYLPHYYEDGMPADIYMSAFFRASKKRPDKYHIVCYREEYDPCRDVLCSSIRNYAYISPVGRVLPCTVFDGFDDVRKDYPTIFEKPFAECVSAPNFMNIVKMTTSELHKANEQCRTCKFNKHCTGGCRPSVLYLGEKNLMATNKIECALYYGGWVKKIAETVQKARPSAECPVKDLSMLQ